MWESKKFFKIHNIHFLETMKKKIIQNKISEMKNGEICLLENIRFNSEEENDLIFQNHYLLTLIFMLMMHFQLLIVIMPQ